MHQLYYNYIILCYDLPIVPIMGCYQFKLHYMGKIN